jgi:hypothetical protein
MSDDFGTVNVRPSARSREIEAIRQHYRAHRDTLARLAGEAPSEQLAAEYHRLIASIDASLVKLAELAGVPPSLAAAPLPTAASRPLVMTPGEPAPSVSSSSSSRIFLIIFIGLLVLVAIAWLIWRASSERPPSAQRTTTQPVATSTTPVETGTIARAVTPAPAASASLRVTPAVQDYGIIRRGTRAVREFELINTGSIPISIAVSRSACRCLFYAYNGKKIAPNAHETITVTVDGARAKSQVVDEQLAVTAKEDPSAAARIGIRATIK